jgi:lipopolysaccharide export system permease protein
LLTIIDRYILRKFLGTFIFSIALILAIFIVFDVKDRVQNFLNAHIPLKDIITDYYLMFIPVYGNMFSPLFTFISIILFTAKMAHRTEFVAILSSGASFNRILKPYLIGAFIIGFSSFMLNHFVIPKAQEIKIGFEDKWFNSGYSTEDKNIHKKIAPGTILYMAGYDNRINTGTRVSIEKFVGSKQIYIMKAETMKWDSTSGEWIFRDVFERSVIQQDKLDTLKNQKPIYAQKHTFLPEKRLKLDFHPKDMWRYESKVEIMNTPELRTFITKETLRGASNIEHYEIELYKRTSFPFATFILTIIAVSISSRKVRGGVGLQIALGLFLSCIYIMLMYIFSISAASGVGYPGLMVWAPNIIFSCIAFYFYKTAQQ